MQAHDEFPFKKDYQWGNNVLLGEGSFGRVFKSKDKHTGQPVAIKQLNMNDFKSDPQLIESLRQQFQISKKVKGEHLLCMHRSHIGQNFSYMVLQMCDGDLQHEIAKKLSIQIKIYLFLQVIKGFKVLVAMNYIHRDIKPANILLKEGKCKIADFGFACRADISCNKKMKYLCGTPLYMSPQIMQGLPYTAKTDIWSLGMMLYFMLFGFFPWPASCYQQLIRAVMTRPLSIPYNANIGQNTIDFLRRALVVDQNKRMNWIQVFEHPLIMHKDMGKSVIKNNIDSFTKQALIQVQHQIKKKNINLNQIFAKYKGNKLIREICPFITTEQSIKIFKFADQDRDETVSTEQFSNLLSHIDYRGIDDISRHIDEIAAIIKHLKISIHQLVKQIDVNKSGKIDWRQFTTFVENIAPKYNQGEVLKIFKVFCPNVDGLISLKDFETVLNKRIKEGNQINCIFPIECQKKNELRQYFGDKDVVQLSKIQLQKISQFLNQQISEFELHDIYQNKHPNEKHIFVLK